MRPKKKKKMKKATEKSKNLGSKSNYELVCTYLNAADKISLVKSLNQ